MNRPVIIIGGEGNGGVVAACIDDNRKRFSNNTYVVHGFLTDFQDKGTEINRYPVLGSTYDIEMFLKNDEFMYMYAIHPITRGRLREKIFNRLNIPIEKYASVIHHTAFIPDTTIIEPGVLVMSGSYIGPATRIRHNTLIKANCLIGHNNDIGSLSTFSAGCIVSSYVTIGKASDIAFGARVMEKVSIGNYATAGAASLVLKDIPDSEVHVGSPAKFIKKTRED
jgi:acetyltransferase EpsM